MKNIDFKVFKEDQKINGEFYGGDKKMMNLLRIVWLKIIEFLKGGFNFDSQK